ncbi:MAG: hypothetical protein LBP22_13640 [Deltaproteobacteria bacterium]|jgi:hypothetical protein|nr:hypothetical protein [Deltaproteobacteria bacterium]
MTDRGGHPPEFQPANSLIGGITGGLATDAYKFSFNPRTEAVFLIRPANLKTSSRKKGWRRNAAISEKPWLTQTKKLPGLPGNKVKNYRPGVKKT